jgi:hypothetical protein
MFIVALFTIAKLRKQPRCPVTNKWIKKTWCTYPMEFYSIVNENMSFAGKCIELEGIMISEASPVQKDKGSMFFLICGR